MRKLSKDFATDINKDRIKRCILPAKYMLEMLFAWPGKSSKHILALQWLNFVNIMILEMFHALYVVSHRTDIVDAILVCTTVSTTFQALVKIYVIVTKRQIFNDILYKIWKHFWPVATMSSRKIKALSMKCTVTVGLTLGCFGPAVFCNALITLWPYLVNRELIFKSAYPFRWNQTNVYEILYIWQYFSGWYILMVVNIFDNFVIAIMAICTVQYIILQNVFKDIFTEKSKKHRLLLFEKEISDTKMVSLCLDQQRMLIGVCEQLETILNIPTLVQFFNSTAGLCASCIILKVDSSRYVTMLTFAIAHMFQLFNYCYVGHELTAQSGNVANAIYGCKWETSNDRNFKKIIVILIQRSQKEQIFTAASITELNLMSYVKIMRLSFSFYTLLNNLIDRK